VNIIDDMRNAIYDIFGRWKSGVDMWGNGDNNKTPLERGVK
jgi:hypothetical protein